MTQIKIYIPSIFRNSKAVNDFKTVILREFKGLTVYDALGYWVNLEKQTESETVKVYEILTQNPNLEDINAIVKAECEKLKLLLNQNSVLYCLNGILYFV